LLGEDGVAELINAVAAYTMIAITVKAPAMKSPDPQDPYPLPPLPRKRHSAKSQNVRGSDWSSRKNQ